MNSSAWKKAAITSFRNLLLLAAVFSPVFPLNGADTPSRALNAPEVRATMERVADWQLNHPCALDLRWRVPGANETRHARIGWDGTLLRARTVQEGERSVSTIPDAWRTMNRLDHGGVAFSELPKAVQSAWLKSTGLDPSAIISIVLLDEGATRGWEMGTLYRGLSALSRLSKNPVYRAALRDVGESQGWILGRRIYHADDHTIGDLYLDFYATEKKLTMLADVQGRFDWIMKHPDPQPLAISAGQQRWTWCDALFMSPPVWLKLAKLTGDRSYLEFMDREWWATTEFLYSPSDALYYRDSNFFERREPNGQKVFWSRGNAWVLAALAMIIPDLPSDLPSRPKYIQLFKDMAAKIATLQPQDGLWRSSLLDPASSPNPEASSTALFCYAYARGINEGILERSAYAPAVSKTWIALQGCVSPDGHLGFIQQPGAAPGSADATSTAPYGVGAFLLAGSEVFRFAESP